MRILATILALALFAGVAGAINYDIVRPVPNDGPTNLVGTNYLPPDDSGTTWTPLQPGDTFSGVDDSGQPISIPVGEKLNSLATPTKQVSMTLNTPPAPAPAPAPLAPVNYDSVRQIPNDGPTNFVGTNGISPDDSDTVWTPLQVGDTITKVDDFGNVINVPVGPKIIVQKRSTVNSWLTLSRKGGALRIMN